MIKRLAIITTHSIQYYAPLFKLLTERNNISIKVFYTWGEQSKGKIFDPGFGKAREWDIPLLEGYDYEFVSNVASDPGSHHFWGINNPGLIKRIKTWNADAAMVIGWNFKSHLQAMMYFKGNIPVLFRGDSTLLDEKNGFSVKKIIRRLALKFVYRFIDYALYVGTNNRAYYLNNGVSFKKLIYAPHAIDNERFEEDGEIKEQEALQWKIRLGIPINKMSVLFAGKLENKKNPLIIIEAAEQLPGIHFIIVGNGQLEKEIKMRSNHLKNITLLPFQNQSKMPIVYRLADVFVLPSVGPGETWGLAINEAMASSRIVVASDKCGGAIDLIKPGLNGYIFLHNNLHSLVNILKPLAENKKDLSTQGQLSHKEISLWSYKHLAEKIEVCVNKATKSNITSHLSTGNVPA